MITFDKLKITTKANYAKNINVNMGEFRYNNGYATKALYY
jgi:hypothetical protein